MVHVVHRLRLRLRLRLWHLNLNLNLLRLGLGLSCGCTIADNGVLIPCCPYLNHTSLRAPEQRVCLIQSAPIHVVPVNLADRVSHLQAAD